MPLLLAGCAAGGSRPGPARGAPAPRTVRVGIDTTLGSIEVDIEAALVPKVAAWFLGLVDRGAFDGTRFFRAGWVRGPSSTPGKPRFIEGGMAAGVILGETGERAQSAAEAGLPLLRDWETTAVSGLRFTRGAFGFGRDIIGDGSVIPEMVIALEDVPEFDHGSAQSPGRLGFPVAGRVVAGMDVVDRIAARPLGGKTRFAVVEGQILSEPVVMRRVARIRR